MLVRQLSCANAACACIDNTVHTDDAARDETNAQREERIMDGILANEHADYDMDHALVLVQMHGFKAGQLFLYEQLEMYHMVIQHYMEEATGHAEAGRIDEARDARRTIISKCVEFGEQDPNLWVLVLTYLADSYTNSNDRDEDEAIQEVLEHIESAALLPPLLVVQLVSRNAAVPLGVVRDFVVGFLGRQASQVRDDQREIKTLREETEEMREHIFNLRSRAEVFQARNCRHCNIPLDLPAVHFLCKHSYHQHCISENETECPECRPDFQRVLRVQNDLGAKSGADEVFSREVRWAPVAVEHLTQAHQWLPLLDM